MSAEELRPPMELGEVLDYADYRSAAKTYIRERANAVKRYETQAKKAAKAEGDYQRAKATATVRLRAEVTATEAELRVRGEQEVVEARIKRDTERQIVHARREDIEGIDEASAHLRKVADWSQRLGMGNEGTGGKFTGLRSAA